MMSSEIRKRSSRLDTCWVPECMLDHVNDPLSVSTSMRFGRPMVWLKSMLSFPRNRLPPFFPSNLHHPHEDTILEHKRPQRKEKTNLAQRQNQEGTTRYSTLTGNKVSRHRAHFRYVGQRQNTWKWMLLGQHEVLHCSGIPIPSCLTTFLLPNGP